ncbi:MAG: EutN/CcmL family microcompartment protein [Dehalococcoidia bacterium]
MQLGEVIGRVSSTQKMESLRGMTMVIIHQLSPEGNRQGGTLVAVDPIGVGDGQRVIYMTGGAATKALEAYKRPGVAVDAAIVAIVDTVSLRK